MTDMQTYQAFYSISSSAEYSVSLVYTQILLASIHRCAWMCVGLAKDLLTCAVHTLTKSKSILVSAPLSVFILIQRPSQYSC